MSRSGRSPRPALSRALVVLLLVGGSLVAMAGTSLAAAVEAINPNTSSTAVPAGPTGGVAVGTLSWAVAGFVLLVLGFVAASRSGRRELAATRTSPMSAGAVRFFQSPAQEAPAEPSSAMTV